jgi:hypothetical protein
MKSSRYLLIDLLEDRRLMAGLDVRVFDDPFSSRAPSASSSPAAERVVYLDLNSDGNHQASEPMSISDIDGIARFRNIDPGSYVVRLLGSSKSQIQTTDTAPAPAGTWTGKLGATQTLVWQSDSVGWFVTPDSLIEFDIDQATVINQIRVPGRILSATMESQTQGVALLLTTNSQTQIIGFDLQTGQIKNWNDSTDLASGLIPGASRDKELISLGGTTFLRRTSNNGDELLQLPNQQTWHINPQLTTVASGISQHALLQSIGNQHLIVSESLIEGSRLTVLNYNGETFELLAQRDFESFVRVSSSSPDSQSFAIETNRGVEILSVASALPTQLVLEEAIGPTLFDLSRGIFWSLSKLNTSRLIGWTIAEGSKVFDVLFAEAGTSGNATRTQLSLGFRNDSLIGLRDGQIYRHSLSIARGTLASVIDQVIQQVAIGIRSRGPNNTPVLQSLPAIQATEDMPASIQTSDWIGATSDTDNDTVHYVIVRGGQLGTVSWSTTSGGVYTPKPNANGQDQIVVQAYDGRGWSTPQTVSIQIQPVNDAPQGLLYSGVLAIPEKQPGYVLGSLSIIDPDANEVFDYGVSDGRFEVVGNTLKVRDTAIIPYQNPGWIDLVLSARSRTNGQTIDRTERIFIVQDPTPFHNDNNPGDVDGDGRITPLDPLIIINYINSNGSGQIPPPGEGEGHNDMDVDGDGQVSPLDILLVINALNQSTGEAEGEYSGTGSDLQDPLRLRKPRR